MSETSVRLTWRQDGKHDIELEGIMKPRELRILLEYGLKHIRMCLMRGKPLGTKVTVPVKEEVQ